MLLLKPALYTEPTESGDVFLKGGRCCCGYTYFPLQAYGCEQCGAVGEDLHAVDLKGTGRLVASAVVHMHAGEGRTAPFIVGSIQLDDGPVVRTLLDYPADAPLLPTGSQLQAILVEVVSPNSSATESATKNAAEREALFDLRFTPDTQPEYRS